MLKIVLVAHLTYENQWGKLHTQIQTFVFFGTPQWGEFNLVLSRAQEPILHSEISDFDCWVFLVIFGIKSNCMS